MPDNVATFEFDTNLPAVVEQIDAGLSEIESLLGRGFTSSSGSDLTAGLQSQFAQITSRYAQTATKLGDETAEAIKQGLNPSTFTSQLTKLGAQLRDELTKAFEQSAQSFRISGGQIDPRVLSTLSGRASQAVTSAARERLPDIRRAARETNPELKAGQVTSQFIGSGTGEKALQDSMSLSAAKIDAMAEGSTKLDAQFAEFADRLKTAGSDIQLSTKDLSLLQQGSQGKGALAGAVEKGSGGYVFNSPTAGPQAVDTTGVLRTGALAQSIISPSNEGVEKLTESLADLTAEARATGGALGEMSDPLAEFTRDGQLDIEKLTKSLSELRAQAAATGTTIKDATGGAGSLGGGKEEGKPDSVGESFLGSFFGRGFDSNQAFNPKAALGNLAGTAGVLARYGSEGQALFGTEKVAKSSFTDYEDYQNAQINLQEALKATGTAQVSTTAAINAGAQAGLSSSQSIVTGAEALKAYGDYVTSSSSATDIFTESVKAAGIAAVETGQSVADAQQQLIAATQGFQSGPGSQSRINDAVVNASNNFGGDKAQILQGVAASAADAQEAGIDPETLANMISLVQRDTGGSGSTISSEIQKLIVRGQNSTFLSALQNAGIQNSGDLGTELPALSKHYNSLNSQGKNSFVTSLGGARAIGDLLPLLRDGAQLTDANNKSYENGGAAAEDYAKRLNDIGGVLRQLGGEFKELTTDIGNSGIFIPLGAALELLKPGLQTIDDLLNAFQELDSVLPGPLSHLEQIAVVLGEVALARKALQNSTVRSIFGKAPVAGNVAEGGSAAENAGALGEETAAQTEANAAKSTGVEVTEAALAARDLETKSIIAQTDVLLTNTEALLANDAAQAGGSELGALGRARGGVSNFLNRGSLAEGEEASGFGGKLLSRIPGLQAGEGIGLPEGLVALAGATAIDSTYKTVHGIIGADNTANGAGITGSSVDQLHAQAEKLGNDAQAARASSGGLLGSTLNFLAGNPTGRASAQAKQGAQQADYEASQLAAAQQKAATYGAGGLSTLLDTSSAANINSTVSNLTTEGYTAGQVLDALTDKLGQLAQSASAASGVILPGQSGVIARQVGNAGANELRNFQTGLQGNDNFNLSPESALKGLNYQGLGDALTSNANSFFSTTGLSAGGTITPAQVKQLTAQQKNTIVSYLKSQGKTTQQIAALMQDINLTAENTVKSEIAAATGQGGSPLTQAQIGAIESNAISLASTKGQNVTTTSTLDNGDGQVAGAQANVDALQKTYNALLKDPGVNASKLGSLKQAIDAGNLALDNAIAASVQAKYQALAAETSQYNKAGSIDENLKGLEAALPDTKGAEQREQLQGQIAQAKQQKQAQTLADQNSKIGTYADTWVDGTPVTNSVQDAQVALEQAQNTYKTIKDQGGKGQSLTDAQNALFTAQLAFANAEVQNANDTRDGQVAVGDAVGAAYAQYQDLINDASTLTGGAKLKELQQAASQLLTAGLAGDTRTAAVAGEGTTSQQSVALAKQKLKADRGQLNTYETLAPGDTTDIANLKQSVLNDRQSLALAQTQKENDEALAGLNPQQTVAIARQGVADAKAKLADDTKYSDQYYQDLEAYHAAMLTLAQAAAQKAGDTALANANPASQLSQAQAALKAAEDNLGVDKKGTDQYEKDKATVKSDKFTVRQDTTNTENARIDASVAPGNDVSAAAAQVKTATNSLKLYKKGTEEYYEALVAQKQAEYDYAQALIAHNQVLAEIGGDVTDPVAQAIATLNAAKAQLAYDQAHKTGDTSADELAVLQDQYAAQKAAFDQQNTIEQNLYQLHQISGAQYLKYLDNEQTTLEAQLAGMQQGSQGYEQTLEELQEVQADILSANEQLTGQFNVGNINLSGAVYQERRIGALNGIDLSPDTTGAGTNLGASNPAAQALQPLTDAVTAVTQPAANAATAITSLAAAIALLTSAAGATAAAGAGGTGGSTSISINAASYADLQNLIQQLVGGQALSTMAPITNRKVSS